MSHTNPYQAPTATLETSLRTDDCWRDGAQLVVRDGARLPANCVKCGAAARVPMPTKTFHWHHPALFLLLPAGVLIYAIVAALTRKHVAVTVGLCPRHAYRRAQALLASVGVVVVGVVLLIVALARQSGVLAVAGGVLVIAALALGLLRGRTLVPVRIDAGQARFRGCDERFLARLAPHRDAA